MAFTSIAALIGGAEVTAAVVLGAVTEVGATLSVVGLATGNKSLMKIGASMALIGGVGGLIAGAGAGAAGAAGAAVEGGADGAASAALSSTAGLGDDMVANVGADSAASTALDTTAQAAPVNAGAAQPQALAPPEGIVAPVAQPQAMPTPTPAGPQVNVGPTAPAELDLAKVSDPFTRGVMSPGGVNAPSDSNSFFSNFGQWADKNKTLLASGVQVLGGAMNGANQTAMWNEKMQLDRDRMARANTVGSFAPRPTGIVAGAAR